MPTINRVDFNKVAKDALDAAKAVANDENAWRSLKDIVKNISAGLTADVQLIAKKKSSGEFNEDDARVYLEDQKMVARIRIRSVAIISLQLAERIWNAIAAVFRSAINKAIGWNII
ncbi:MAG: hypothetical protein ACREXW_07915 [Gammaproteobacteria bacterium]